MRLPSRRQIRQLESVFASHPSGLFDLAAAPRQLLDATTLPTSPRKTRVRGFRRHASGQTSRRGRGCSMFTPGSRGYGCKTVSGRHEWPSKDPIGFDGGNNWYAYVGNNPVNGVDPLGLYGLWDFGYDSLNFASGLGNAITFGGTTWLAEQLSSDSDAAIIRQAKNCSGSFKAGEWASLGLGAGRLAYAGLSKGASLAYAAEDASMADAEAASAIRNSLKKWFRVNPWSTYKVYPFEQMQATYGTANEIIAAAGRTDKIINIVGAEAATGGATTLATSRKCPCK